MPVVEAVECASSPPASGPHDVVRRAAFGPIAARVIHVDAPGSVTGDPRSLPYRKARRTIWPLGP